MLTNSDVTLKKSLHKKNFKKELTSRIFLKLVQIIKKKADNQFKKSPPTKKNGPKTSMDTFQKMILNSSRSLLIEEIENKSTKSDNSPDFPSEFLNARSIKYRIWKNGVSHTLFAAYT